ncbi:MULTISPECIES: hypothetical protein [Actinomycetes]|jgi:hypothetical protein|uniref:Uncharacterized protein n=1 Tax=Williamsia marianensis TaxID=85044 RepID=A0A2G3PH89_WILMA|nr:MULTISPECIES: hypothetical protein [Actinomycetes]PZU04113.1 MAG: hypothetical protein DI630_02070 [Gordonia sp. (in: high G+C Gram-positive bacteria)]MCK0520209.1 hypothetical protein [Williamsia sp. DF01-3]MDV7132757.1 hypothetical protein [Williamsia muralis]PHV65187.1 hypothetical protein CSW57_15325 [Williamsia marianensis]PVY29007.1 hypothetical protein C7458_107216 [Williamsia marianensis]
MKQKLIRAAAAVAATVGIAAGSVVAAAPAQAAPVGPFDLDLTGGVSCEWGKPGDPWVNAWHTKRWMKVTAYGRDWPNVTLQEFNGAQKFAPVLKKGQSLTIETKWFGCFPTSISGYTISSEIDPLQNNIGYWFSVQSIPN